MSTVTVCTRAKLSSVGQTEVKIHDMYKKKRRNDVINGERGDPAGEKDDEEKTSRRNGGTLESRACHPLD